MTHHKLKNDLLAIAESELEGRNDGSIWGHKPDRWWDDAHWRCVNEHVSQCLLGTDRGKICLTCGEPVWLTFPEDKDGPLDLLTITGARVGVKG